MSKIKDVFASDVASRRSAYRIHPASLKPDPQFNGRLSLPDVTKFEEAFKDPRIGQVNAILVRKDNEGNPVIVDGVCRWRAAMNLTERREGPHEDGAFFLMATYTPAKTPEEVFALTVTANIRNEVTAEDNAHNVAIFVHRFGWDYERMATLYHRTTATGTPDVDWVKTSLAINDLSPEALERMRSGALTGDAALELASMSHDVQRARLAAVGTKKLTVTQIRKAAKVSAPTVDPDGAMKQAAIDACAALGLVAVVKPGRIEIRYSRGKLGELVDLLKAAAL